MYPKISDFLNDILGTHLILPIQTFGFFVALAFLVGYTVIRSEYRRRTAHGQFPSRDVWVTRGAPMPFQEVLIQTLIFGLLGFKLGLLLTDYTRYASHPQEMITPLANGNIVVGLVCALLAFGWNFYHYQKTKNSKAEKVMEKHSLLEDSAKMFTLAFIFGILGAKLFHALENWGTFMADPIGMLASFDGLTFYGGLICATIAVGYWVRRNGYDVLTVADATLPTVMLGYGIGRLGCHFSGDGDWGVVNPYAKPSFLPDWAWAYKFPNNVISEGVPIPGCVGEYCNELPAGVYPTSLYEAILGIGLFFVLWRLRDRLPYIGQISGLFLMFNGIERFMIEKIRVNNRFEAGTFSFTQAEMIATLLFLIGLGLFVLAMRVWKKPNIAVAKP